MLSNILRQYTVDSVFDLQAFQTAEPALSLPGPRLEKLKQLAAKTAIQSSQLSAWQVFDMYWPGGKLIGDPTWFLEAVKESGRSSLSDWPPDRRQDVLYAMLVLQVGSPDELVDFAVMAFGEPPRLNDWSGDLQRPLADLGLIPRVSREMIPTLMQVLAAESQPLNQIWWAARDLGLAAEQFANCALAAGRVDVEAFMPAEMDTDIFRELQSRIPLDAQREVLRGWTTDLYQSLQNFFREGRNDSDGTVANKARLLEQYYLDKAERAPAGARPGVPCLWRGMHGFISASFVKHKWLHELGYLAFSCNRDIAEEFSRGETVVRLDLADVPAGTPWVWFGHNRAPASQADFEEEVLLPPGRFLQLPSQPGDDGFFRVQYVPFRTLLEVGAGAAQSPVAEASWL